MPQLDEFSRGYLRLTLEINKHIDGYVDSYYGPDDLKAEVEAGEEKTPEALLDDVIRLREQLPTDNAQRREYLEGVLRAMDCTVRQLNGETFEYLDEVHRLYDIQPELIEESTFTAAHGELDTLLPGEGSIADRMEAFRKQFEVPVEKLLHVFEVARTEVRRSTLALIDLIPGESIEVQLTSNQPWSGYNWFKGNAHSLVEINTDVPVSALDVANLMAHEGYPGHHTEHHLKEKLLYHDCGYGEVASALLHSPSAVIAEGIATTALEIIFPEGAWGWISATLLPAAGLSPADPDQLKRIAAAREALRWVSPNAAILHHTGRLDEAQTIEYYRDYALVTEQRARQMFSFATNPLFRSYIFTYTEGYTLIAQGARGGDKTPVFKRLLTGFVLPSKIPSLN
jgi:hypothetical protein